MTLIFLAPRRTLIIHLPEGSTKLLSECLMGLPCLHTLGIASGGQFIDSKALKSISRTKLDFPNITKVVIPVSAHPILTLLPKVEEIICFCEHKVQQVIKPVLRGLRKPYLKERCGEIEPVLKSFAVVSPVCGWCWTKGAYTTSSPSSSASHLCIRVDLVRKFPRLRRVCLLEVDSPPLPPLSPR